MSIPIIGQPKSRRAVIHITVEIPAGEDLEPVQIADEINRGLFFSNIIRRWIGTVKLQFVPVGPLVDPSKH